MPLNGRELSEKNRALCLQLQVSFRRDSEKRYEDILQGVPDVEKRIGEGVLRNDGVLSQILRSSKNNDPLTLTINMSNIYVFISTPSPFWARVVYFTL